MDRAYSLLTVKAVDDGDVRTFSGMATTPAPDRMGDVINPLGARFSNPLPLLHQHDHSSPIGQVVLGTPTKNGIPFTAKIAQVDEPGSLKDRVDTAWGEIKNGLVRAVSIGFSPDIAGYSPLPDGSGYKFDSYEIIELSAVTIPANAQATISYVKSLVHDSTGASGIAGTRAVKAHQPGASGHKVNPNRRSTATMATKTIPEQIADFEAQRHTKAARLAEIIDTAGNEGSTPSPSDDEECDTLEAEIASIDKHLDRLRRHQQIKAAGAVAVAGGNARDAGQARANVRVEVRGAHLPKGTSFTRYALALARSKGNLMQASAIAERWQDTPEVAAVLKAAVNAGTTTDPTWAKPLVEYQNMASEFAELLRPATIIGRIPGLRRVPFNIKIPRQTGGSTVGWVGQAAAKPVSALAFDQITLGTAKTAGIVVLSDELVRSSNPAAEALVRQDLIDQTAQFLDQQFVDPAVAAVANVSPASITNGVTPITASGTDEISLRKDLKALIASFVTLNLSLDSAVWIMSATQALAIAMMQNPLGQQEFPGMAVSGADGGTLLGLPVILSQSVPLNPGSGAGNAGAGSRIILAKASEILLADDGETMLDVSAEASLQMDSAPTGGAASLVSLWQQNLLGLRAERYINWAKRRDGAVAYIDSANYTQ